MKLITWITALFLLVGEGAALAQQSQAGASPPAASAVSVKDPAAMALLKRMCDRLQTAKTFTVKGRASLELPVAGGDLATFYTDVETSARRPDGLAGRRTGDLPEFRFVYDGKKMTVYEPGTGKWGTTSAPATLDAMLPAAGEQGDLNLPFDEFVVADPYAAITKGLTDAVQVGTATIQGKKVEHLVLSSAVLRLEYWIDPATALPMRSLVVYLDHPLQPHFSMEFSEWKVDSKLSDATFALPKPKGATEVDFREAAGAYR